MRQRILIRAAQLALHAAAAHAERIDTSLKAAFHEAGLATPTHTRGEDFADAMRAFAARLERRGPDRGK
jgi:hypothetical protein